MNGSFWMSLQIRVFALREFLMESRFSNDFQVYCYTIRTCLALDGRINQARLDRLMAELSRQLRRMHKEGVSSGRAVLWATSHIKECQTPADLKIY
jgi:hypothetical protein